MIDYRAKCGRNRIVSVLPLTLCLLLAHPAWSAPAPSRPPLTIIAEKSVAPLALAAGANAGSALKDGGPRIDTMDGNGAVERFCAGVGPGYPDLLLLPRGLDAIEARRCMESGSGPEAIRIGFQAAVLAVHSDEAGWGVTRQQVFLAVARDAPTGPDQILRPNGVLRWNDIESSLPDRPIRVLGPDQSSALANVFFELVVRAGARGFARLDSLSREDPLSFSKIVESFRSDGAFLTAAEGRLATVLEGESDGAIAILDFETFRRDGAPLAALDLDGVQPTAETIRSGTYPGGRPIYMFLKSAHAPFTDDLVVYAAEIVSEAAAGEGGYLRDLGLVPDTDVNRDAARKSIGKLRPDRP